METKDYTKVKAGILANLEDLKEKAKVICFGTEAVQLNSDYFDEETQERYFLAIELIVNIDNDGDGYLFISGFTLENQFLYKEDGKDPKFRFTKAELIDYIDF